MVVLHDALSLKIANKVGKEGRGGRRVLCFLGVKYIYVGLLYILINMYVYKTE